MVPEKINISKILLIDRLVIMSWKVEYEGDEFRVTHQGNELYKCYIIIRKIYDHFKYNFGGSFSYVHPSPHETNLSKKPSEMYLQQLQMVYL